MPEDFCIHPKKMASAGSGLYKGHSQTEAASVDKPEIDDRMTVKTVKELERLSFVLDDINSQTWQIIRENLGGSDQIKPAPTREIAEPMPPFENLSRKEQLNYLTSRLVDMAEEIHANLQEIIRRV